MRRIAPLLLLPACVSLAAQGSREEADRAFDQKDYPTALALYKAGAERGEDWSQWMLGTMQMGGLGLPQDPAQGLLWLRKAASQGNAALQFNLGLVYLRGDGGAKDAPEAASWLRLAAEKGHSEALKVLVLLYETGDLPKNPPDEAKWFKLAAEGGDATAQDIYGMMCLNGQGVAKSVPEGLRWVRSAALHGIGFSKARLAFFYFEGTIVKADLVEAYAWCLLAHEAGSDKEPLTPATLGESLTQSQIARGRKRAEVLRSQFAPAPAAAPAAKPAGS